MTAPALTLPSDLGMFASEYAEKPDAAITAEVHRLLGWNLRARDLWERYAEAVDDASATGPRDADTEAKADRALSVLLNAVMDR